MLLHLTHLACALAASAGERGIPALSLRGRSLAPRDEAIRRYEQSPPSEWVMGLPMLGRVFDAVGFRVPGGGGLEEAFVSFDKDRSGALTEPEFEASLPTQWRDALQARLDQIASCGGDYESACARQSGGGGEGQVGTVSKEAEMNVDAISTEVLKQPSDDRIAIKPQHIRIMRPPIGGPARTGKEPIRPLREQVQKGTPEYLRRMRRSEGSEGEGSRMFAQLLQIGVTEAKDDDDDGGGHYRKQQLYDDDGAPVMRVKSLSNGVGVASGFGGGMLAGGLIVLAIGLARRVPSRSVPSRSVPRSDGDVRISVSK